MFPTPFPSSPNVSLTVQPQPDVAAALRNREGKVIVKGKWKDIFIVIAAVVLKFYP